MYAQIFDHTQTRGDQPVSVTGGADGMMFRVGASVLFPELEKGSAASPLRVPHHFKRGCQTAYGDVCSWQLVTLQHQKSMFASRLFNSRAAFAYLMLSGRVWCKASRLFLIDCTFTLGGPTFEPPLQEVDWFLHVCNAFFSFFQPEQTQCCRTQGSRRQPKGLRGMLSLTGLVGATCYLC